MLCTTLPTKTFIRGKIPTDEKFFICALQSYSINRFSESEYLINYVSVKRGKYISFTSWEGETIPLLFTYRLKNGEMYLYIEGKRVTKFPINVYPLRNVDVNNLYSGVWYNLLVGESQDPVPWDFFNPILTPLTVKKELIGSRECGYLSNSESGIKSYPGTGCVYTFIPEKYMNLSLSREMGGFESFKKWVLYQSEGLKGVVRGELGEWFEYPKQWEPQYLTGIVKKGEPKKGIKREIVRDEEEDADTFSFFYPSDSPPPDDDGVIWILLLMLLLGFIFGFIGYSLIKKNR